MAGVTKRNDPRHGNMSDSITLNQWHSDGK